MGSAARPKPTHLRTHRPPIALLKYMKNPKNKSQLTVVLMLSFLTAGQPAGASFCSDMVTKISGLISGSAGKVTSAATGAVHKVTEVAAVATTSWHPEIDPDPKELSHGMNKDYYGSADFRVYRDYHGTGDSDFTLWDTEIHQGHEATHGLSVVAARLYEFLGYKTSQPRIATVENKKVVLRKRMDEWRKIDEIKIKMTDLDDGKGLDDSYRRLYFASALIGDRYRLGTYGNSVFGSHFSLNEFNKALRGEDKGPLPAETDAKKILESVPVTWLPIDHPWKQLNEEDIKIFLERLKQLNDRTIRYIISLGQLKDSALEEKLFTALKTRRDALISGLNTSILPKAPSPELLAAVLVVTAKEDAFPWGDEEKTKYYNERVDRNALHEKILKSFIAGEHADANILRKSIWFLEGAEKYKTYHFDVEIWKSIYEKILTTADRKDTPKLKDYQEAGETVARMPFLYEGKRADLLTAFSEITVRQYHKDALGLQKVIKRLWSFPATDDSRNSYDLFKEMATALASVNQPRAIEVMLLSLVSAALDDAQFYDGWLSRGGGFHNAARINGALNHGAQAIQDFLSMGVPRSEITKDLNLPDLIEIQKGMKYDSLGRRKLGQNITVHEAFNLGGATRTDKYNIYDVVRSYVIGEQKVLPEIIMKTLEAPKQN